MVGTLICILIAIITFKKKLLTKDGAITIAIMLAGIERFGSWKALVMIIWAYFSLSVIDKFFDKKIQNSTREIHQKNGIRDASQVLANGGMSVLAIVLFAIMGQKKVFYLMYLVAIGEAYADSMASDVGVLSKSSPIDICSLRKIQNGLSGGISLLGTSASIGGLLLYITLAWLISDINFGDCIMVFIASFGGCIIDSILGSKLQVKKKCKWCGIVTERYLHCGDETKYFSGIKWMDNTKVNILSNIIACILLFIMWGIGNVWIF